MGEPPMPQYEDKPASLFLILDKLGGPSERTQCVATTRPILRRLPDRLQFIVASDFSYRCL
jgi:hypothetical protein